ncbi:ribosomal protein L10 [Collinsella intestinalis DSM 13280]|uniref:Large ribosomal subunit protein uL10 n=2 Tax=Collinsella intestinalis TaxID=147207 RepID=C4F9W5_9ACTN|nr:ribosomal protein L10 [Collinsella intestinalis DSM 13280]
MPPPTSWRSCPEKKKKEVYHMPKQYKIDAVAEIESKIESNAGVYVVSYNGLTVLQAQELRKQLREAGAQMKVYKNNLVRIALENKEQPNLDEMLVGPLAYVFFEEEPVSAAKVLKEFAKKSKGVLEIKGGISDGQAVSAAEVDAIAELPSKDQLLGQIAGLINGFARDIAVCVNGVSSGLARTVQQISEQKAA